MVARFDVIACDVTDIQVNDVKRPTRYEQAIKNKESAREDIEVRVNIYISKG